MGRDSAVQVQGLAELRKELRLLNGGKKWASELGKVSRKVSRAATLWARGEAVGMGGVQAHFARSIRGAGGAAGARIAVGKEANAAFWGAKKRTGWYASPRFSGGKGNQPDWVGATWQVAVAGQGPYAINAALAAHINELIDMYADGIDDITSRAFPD